MSESPKTFYAKSGDVHIAYQVVGDSARDLIFIPALFNHVDSYWEEPSVARFLHRLASFCRLIVFDKRGTGMSDRVAGIPGLEERIDDITAVMDAVGSSRAALFGTSEGGSIAALFAATYPEVVSALVVMGSGAVGFITEDEAEVLIEAGAFESAWGSGGMLTFGAPSVAANIRLQEWAGSVERRGASPGSMNALVRMNSRFDIRSALSSISAPTLVLHRSGDLTYSLDKGRYLGEHIAGARFVELPGTDHLPYWEDSDVVLDLIEEFITGAPPVHEPDRVLATVMFTDIVASTDHAARVGDKRWSAVLDQHDEIIDRELDRYRGQRVNSTGDGVVAIFDSPARAVRCARAICESVTGLDIEVRAGVHTGEIQRRGEDISGLAVHIAARVAAIAGARDVLTSRTVKDLVVGSDLSFEDRGDHQLAGVPDAHQLFRVSQ